MAGPLPASKRSELADRIDAMQIHLRNGGALDEMVWQRLRRDLEELARNLEFRHDSLRFQALLWEMKPDPDKAISLLNQAAGYGGKTLSWYLTRAPLAASYGDCSLITDMLQNSYPAGDKMLLARVVSACSSAGMFISAVKALDDMARLDGGEAAEKSFGFVRPVAAYMVAHDIPELNVARRVVAAGRVLADHGFRHTRYLVRSGKDGVLFEYAMDADVGSMVKVSLAICDALAVQFEDTLSDHLSIGVIPLDEVGIYGG